MRFALEMDTEKRSEEEEASNREMHNRECVHGSCSVCAHGSGSSQNHYLRGCVGQWRTESKNKKLDLQGIGRDCLASAAGPLTFRSGFLHCNAGDTALCTCLFFLHTVLFDIKAKFVFGLIFKNCIALLNIFLRNDKLK